MTQDTQNPDSRDPFNPAGNRKVGPTDQRADASFKPRDQHRGPPTPHLGQSHFRRDQIEEAARKIDQGPSFGTPGEPPEPDIDRLTDIEQGFEDLGREGNVGRSG